MKRQVVAAAVTTMAKFKEDNSNGAELSQPGWRRKGVLPVIFMAMLGFGSSMVTLHFGVNAEPSPPSTVVFHTSDPITFVGAWHFGDSLRMDSISVADLRSDRAFAPVSAIVMNRYPALLVWVILTCIMCAFAFACVPFFWSEWKELRQRHQHTASDTRQDWIAAFCLVAILIALPLVLTGVWTPKDYFHELGTFFRCSAAILGPVIANIVCAGVGITWLGSIATSLRKLKNVEVVEVAELDGANELTDVEKTDRARLIKERDTTLAANAKTKKAYADLRSSLQSALQLLAIIVAFAVLTTAHLRSAIGSLLSTGKENMLFPEEFVHMYGLFFTAMLGIIYLPVHFLMRRSGEYLGIDPEEAPSGKSSNAPSSVAKALTPTLSGFENMKAALSILAPILAGILGKYIEGVLTFNP